METLENNQMTMEQVEAFEPLRVKAPFTFLHGMVMDENPKDNAGEIKGPGTYHALLIDDRLRGKETLKELFTGDPTDMGAAVLRLNTRDAKIAEAVRKMIKENFS
jgi:hypothetical protein